MIEQAVSRLPSKKEQIRIRLLRALQLLLIFLLLSGLVLGITLASVYWQTNQALFWQWVATLLFFGTPMLACCFLLQFFVNRLRVEYDYLLDGESFMVYRITGQRRKPYLSFSAKNMELFLPYDEILPGSPDMDRLQKAELLCCDVNSDRLFLLQVKNVHIQKKTKDLSLLLELKSPLEKALKHLCRISRY